MPKYIMLCSWGGSRPEHPLVTKRGSTTVRSACFKAILALWAISLSAVFPSAAHAESSWKRFLENQGQQIIRQGVDQYGKNRREPSNEPSQPGDRPEPTAPPGPSEPVDRRTPERAQRVPPPRQSPSRVTQSRASSVDPAAERARVAKAQQLLNQLGYDAGPVDGLYGRNTRDAIRAFQADRGWLPDGAVTDGLLTRLSEATSASIVQTASEPPRETTRTAPSVKTAESGIEKRNVKTPGTSAEKLLRAAASKSPFEGITIVRLASNEARFAIAGDYARTHLYRNQESYLVIFISSKGNYASVADNRGQPICTAWADAIDGRTATFGLAIDSYEGRPLGHWCQPFTVRLEGDSRIRLTADNQVPAYGAKGGQTQRMSHDGLHEIVLRVPSLSTDFDLPVFAKHELYGIRLGPIITQDGPPKIKIGHDPLLRPVDIRLAPSQQTSLHAGMSGEAAPSELTGWATDRLIELHDVKRLGGTAVVSSNTFNADLIKKYGNPTLYRSFFQNRSGGQDKGNGMWWLYDHAGRLLGPKDTQMTNCAGDANLWRDAVTLWTINSDLGPWGCSLVVFVSHNAGNYPSVATKEREAHELGLKGSSDDPVFAELNVPRTPATGYPVEQFRQEIVAGDAMAYRHFLVRIKVLAAQRKKLNVKISAPREVAVPRMEPRANEPAAPTVTARKMKNAHFFYEGVHLGMTADQLTAELLRHGIVPSDGGRGERFVTKGAAPFAPNSDTVLVSYSDSAQVREIIFVFKNQSQESGQRESSQKYKDILADYGSPNDCAIATQCRWERHFDGWNETLDYQNATGTGLKISIILSASIDDKEKFAKLAAIDEDADSNDASQFAVSDGPPKSPIAADTFEMREPFGVAIGQTSDQAKAALEAAGYQTSRSWKSRDCKRSAVHHTDASETSVFIRLAGPKTDLRCQRRDSPVQIIEISHFESQGLSDSFDELSDKISRAFKTKPTCENRFSSVRTCLWLGSAVEPLVQKVELRMKPGVVEYGVYGVDDLTAVAHSNAPKAEIPPNDHWWDHIQSGRGSDELKDQLANSKELTQLSADDREQVLKEAIEVYGYCQEQDLFAKLHDCTCVSKKFVVTRREYWQMQEKKYGKRLPESSMQEWLGLADERADQCSSKAGAANFAYTECDKMYGRRLPDRNDRDNFCTCYGNTFADRYMEDSRAYVPNITNIGVAATQACIKRGYPSPLGR